MENPRNLLSIMSRKLKSSYDFIRLQLKDIGLSGLDISHGDILYQLYGEDNIALSDLARRIRKDKSTVTALVHKLAAMELVTLHHDPEDKRRKYLRLTAKGEEFREDFFRISDELFTRLYRDMSTEQQQGLVDLTVLLGE